MRVPFLLTLLLIALANLAGCASVPHQDREVASRMISLEDAKALISSGKVKTIFQPHHGPVFLDLRDGTSHCFNQPYLDWVYDFVKENNLRDKVDAMPVE